VLSRNDWLPLARKLDWDFRYVREEDVFPEATSGRPWLPHAAWADWDEPYKTTYADYVTHQHDKDASVFAVRDALGGITATQRLPMPWVNGLKLHSATLALAEFAAVVGNLRAARFGRDGAWRTAAAFGALDELRHTQIPLLLMHELVGWDAQFDWTHRFFHTNNWVAIAARHLADELLLTADPIEFAIGTNFVFETGFTNLQFVGLSTQARQTGDTMFETMVTSIQSDEARHAQIGLPVLQTVMAHDPAYAQFLVDKWFWRNWLLFAVITGFTMDYLTPLASRTQSFREFVEEWVLDQFLASLDEVGLQKPWYWDHFLASLTSYHHMVYASAYTYRATVWFDMVVPSPEERAWLQDKYPETWDSFAPVWERITERWERTDVGNDLGVHGTAIVGFCDQCQLVLCGGTPEQNAASTLVYEGKSYIFCSPPCRWIFEAQPERYAGHKDVVKRVLAGEAPGNLLALVRQYMGLDFATWGKDVFGGDYPWMHRQPGGPS
jgi:toluene monooxygenase system protein A